MENKYQDYLRPSPSASVTSNTTRTGNSASFCHLFLGNFHHFYSFLGNRFSLLGAFISFFLPLD